MQMRLSMPRRRRFGPRRHDAASSGAGAVEFVPGAIIARGSKPPVEIEAACREHAPLTVSTKRSPSLFIASSTEPLSWRRADEGAVRMSAASRAHLLAARSAGSRSSMRATLDPPDSRRSPGTRHACGIITPCRGRAMRDRLRTVKRTRSRVPHSASAELRNRPVHLSIGRAEPAQIADRAHPVFLLNSYDCRTIANDLSFHLQSL